MEKFSWLSDQGYRVLIDYLQDGIFVIDDGRLVYVNQRLADLFGYPVDELIGRSFIDLVIPEERPIILERHRARLSGEIVPEQYDIHISTASGGVICCSLNVGLSKNQQGHTVTVGSARDVTQQKTALAELKASRAELKSILDQLPDVFYRTNMQGIITMITPSCIDVLGYRQDEMVGTAMTSYYETPAERQKIVQAITEGGGKATQVESTLRHKDGSIIWISTNAFVRTGADGLPSYIEGVARDISARVAAEQSLGIARDEADRANAAKSEFLSNMSHELRTPMNSILGFAQLLEYKNTLSVEHKEFVREIRKAGDHLLKLINEVLDLARVESGHIDLSIESVEICPVIDECLALVSTLADKRRVHMSHDCIKDIKVRADLTRLKQVLLNLLSNSIKYNREGGSVKLKVQTASGDRLRILITDTGTGIREKNLKELFKPFNRLDATHSGIEGTGIGLTITLRLVELMGGTVGVESEVGIGSTFWIELPVDTMDVAIQAGTESANTGMMPAASSLAATQRTVLYIEDNPSNIKLVSYFFGPRKNYQLLTASTAEFGIELALTRHPDLILLDINMPGMDGYQLLEVFKTDARLKTIPIVAITANAMTRDIERGLGAGFSDYLTKPLNMDHFHTVLDKLLISTNDPLSS